MSKYRITLEGKIYEMEIEPIIDEADIPGQNPLDLNTSWKQGNNAGESSVVQIIDPSIEKPVSNDDRSVCSPMPGTVLSVLFSVGDFVKKGEPVLVLEAMKMENEIVSFKDGVISAIHVKEGDSVEGGALLMEIGE